MLSENIKTFESGTKPTVDDFDIKAPVETAFTVEITMLDGHVLKSETPLVTLTPREK